MRRHPVHKAIFPSTYLEFVRFFPDEEACSRYLAGLRWQAGFLCPACKHLAPQPWRGSRERFACPACQRQTSVTAGTVLDKTRTPLTTWFEAAWRVTTAKNGLSAKTLERTLGVRYPVA